MENFETPKDYIIDCCCGKTSFSSPILKPFLLVMAKNLGIDIPEDVTKRQLVEMLGDRLGWERVSAMCRVGVPADYIQEKFSISKADVRKLAKFGVLHITGYDAPHNTRQSKGNALYSVFDYFNLTQNYVAAWLQSNGR